MTVAAQTSTLLICTVGGSPEPIVAALKQWRPMRVRFAASLPSFPMLAETGGKV